ATDDHGATRGEEGGVVVRGQVEVTVGGSTRILGPGEAYYFSRQLPHRFRNVGREGCEIVSASAPPSPQMQFLASAPRGLADLLARELTGLGADDVRERATGVAFSGPLAIGYRACLWSRIANRVFLELAQFEASDTD